MSATYNAPRERLDLAVEHGPAHLRPIMMAVRDCGVSLGIIGQDAGPFSPPDNRPSILIIGDDLFTAEGPTAFHAKSLHRYFKRCRAAVIVSCEPMAAAYASAAAVASLGRDVVIIETRIECEEAWRQRLLASNPKVSLLVATVRPEGGIH